MGIIKNHMYDFMQALQGSVEGAEGVPMIPEEQNLVIFPSGAGVDKEKGLPVFIVVIIQLLAFLWEFGVVAIVMLPWWSILFSIALLDWSLDWVFLGLFFWCKFCAGIFIWNMRTFWDIPIMNTDPGIQSLTAAITSPTVTDKEEFLQIRRANRRLLTDALPGSALINLAADT